MTDKERIESIKTKSNVLIALADDVGTGTANLLTVANDMSWLVEQIKLLEGEKGIKTALNNDAIKIIEEKERQNKRLSDALQGMLYLQAITTDFQDYVEHVERIAVEALEESK